MRIYMQSMADLESTPRYYQLILQQELLGGWSLIREWGVQGARGRTKREEFPHRAEAEQALSVYRNAQLERGYRVVFIQGEESSS